jgi:hypothetical protein
MEIESLLAVTFCEVALEVYIHVSNRYPAVVTTEPLTQVYTLYR